MRETVRRQSAIAQQAVPSGAERLLNHGASDRSPFSGVAAQATASEVMYPIAMHIMLRIESDRANSGKLTHGPSSGPGFGCARYRPRFGRYPAEFAIALCFPRGGR